LNAAAPGPHAFIQGPLERCSKTSKLLFEAAQICGYRHMIEPEFGYVGRIEAAGRRLHYRGGLFDINTCGSSALTRDKAYCFGLLKENNVPTPRTRSFFSPEFESFSMLRGTAAAIRFANELGYPVFVKPNEGTRAFGAFKVDDDDQLCWALERCFARREGRVSLVQSFIEGQELRVLVVDGTVGLGYFKRPLILKGDGEKTVVELIQEARDHVLKLKSGKKTFDLNDPRILDSLKRRDLDLNSQPEHSFRLSDGLTLELGDGVEIIEEIPPKLSEIACRAMNSVGLRYGSVDAIQDKDGQYQVIELNSAPGVTGLASLGHHERAVELYCRVLRAYFND
jgi:glutathione synthase/RimK-type ligase-like ATP-grasp enzyme